MSFPNDRTYSFDANLLLSDNAAAYTATGFSQVGGQNAILDLGGNQGTNPVELARVDAVAVIDATAFDITSGNETYKMVVLVSNDPAFGAGNVAMAGEIEIGKGTSLDGLDMADSVIGRYELMFTNQLAGTIYEFCALYLVIGGTTPSLNISAFLAVLPEC
jgi:hypothetical protein